MQYFNNYTIPITYVLRWLGGNSGGRREGGDGEPVSQRASLRNNSIVHFGQYAPRVTNKNASLGTQPGENKKKKHLARERHGLIFVREELDNMAQHIKTTRPESPNISVA